MFLFLIGVEHRLVGCLSYIDEEDENGNKSIDVKLVAVRPFYQKLKIGKHLMEHVHERMRTGKFQFINLVPIENVQKFYYKLGEFSFLH